MKNEERKTGNVIISKDKLNALIQGYEDLYSSNERLRNMRKLIYLKKSLKLKGNIAN